jgi:hypothetical protein
MTLASCEVYSIAEDKWESLPPMENARQSFSVCCFNDKFIFVFGGRKVSDGSTVNNIAFDYVNDVEYYDIDKKAWKTVTYIADKGKLRSMHSGVAQISGKKVLLFGGITSVNEDSED